MLKRSLHEPKRFPFQWPVHIVRQASSLLELCLPWFAGHQDRSPTFRPCCNCLLLGCHQPTQLKHLTSIISCPCRPTASPEPGNKPPARAAAPATASGAELEPSEAPSASSQGQGQPRKATAKRLGSSVYRGVTWLKRDEQWRAQIYHDGRVRVLAGRFSCCLLVHVPFSSARIVAGKGLPGLALL